MSSPQASLSRLPSWVSFPASLLPSQHSHFKERLLNYICLYAGFSEVGEDGELIDDGSEDQEPSMDDLASMEEEEM